jgi:hypothetical protein
MNINTKTVETLASVLKVDAQKLSAELLTEIAEPSKQVTKITDLIPADVILLTPADKETLLDNHGKSKYNEGKLAEREMSVKEYKKERGLENHSSLKDWRTLIAYEVEQASKSTTDDVVKTLKVEKEALQQTVQAKEAEIAKWVSEVENVKTSTVIQSEVNRAMSEIQIEGDKATAQKEILSMAFMQKHQVKIEDGKAIVYKDGKKLVDSLQNSVSVSQALKEFAPSYVNITVPTGRGDSSSTNTPINGDIAKITDGASMTAYLDSKGLKANSMEAVAIYQEVKAKNPSFKL